MWQRFSPAARDAILRAQHLATGDGSAGVAPVHLFVALLDGATPDSALGALLLSARWNLEEARLYVGAAHAPETPGPPGTEPKLTRGAKRVLELTADEARRAGDTSFEPEHLLLGCLVLRGEESLSATLKPLGWNVRTLRALRQERKNAQRASAHPLQMLTDEAQKAVDAAYAAMRATYCGRISSAHLLLGLLQSENQAVELLRENGVSIEELKAQARAAIRSDNQLATPDKRFDQSAKRALDRAKAEALSRGYRFIGADHLLLGLLPRRPTLRERLTWGTNVEDGAARVLADVDAQRLRDAAGPDRKRRTPSAAPHRDVPLIASSLSFGVAFGVQMATSTVLRLSPPRAATPSVRLAILTMVLVLVASGVGACWMLLTSSKKNLKGAWMSAFIGGLAGLMVGMLSLR